METNELKPVNAIPVWITREPKGQYEDDYGLHFTEPTLADHNNDDTTYWQAKDN